MPATTKAPKKRTTKKAATSEQTAILAFKGFDPDLKCRNYQFAVGQTFKHEGEVAPCVSGFHSCEAPFDVWGYYPPATDKGLTRYAEVRASGKVERHGGDSKIASAELHVHVELSLPEFIKRGVDFILARAKETKAETGYYSAATNTGDQSAATNTGYYSAATNTGYRSAATNTGYYSAATNTGDQSAATNTGYYSAATVEGKHSVALASGFEGRVMATQEGSAIAAVERSTSDYATILYAAIGIVGRDGIKPGQWYRCVGGKLVEA